jgi:hypothetical protein
MNRLRRLEQLEQKAPYVVCRPAALAGRAFVDLMCNHIDTAMQSGLEGTALQRLVSAWVDLCKADEIELIVALGEDMKAAGLCDESYNPTSALLD